MFKLNILCNYPDDKEVEASVPETPLTEAQIVYYVSRLLREEPEMTSCVITIARVL